MTTRVIRKAKPLVKWVGGKAWLAPIIVRPIMAQLRATGGRYIEPFVGGGAVALYLGQPNMLLGDANDQIVNLHTVTRDNPRALVQELARLTVEGFDSETYYRVRALDPAQLSPVAAAARMIYITHIGFNGLYRENASGKCNVPYGRLNDKKIARPERVQQVSIALRDSEIVLADCVETIDRARAGDVVYADPPYDDRTFEYTAGGFTRDHQVRLNDALERAWRRGAMVVISNMDTPAMRSLYDWATLVPIKETKKVNANTRDRTGASCLLCYAVPSQRRVRLAAR